MSVTKCKHIDGMLSAKIPRDKQKAAVICYEI